MHQKNVLADINLDGIIDNTDLELISNAMEGNYSLDEYATDEARHKATHKNVHDSTIKQVIDTWYEENLIGYNSYLADAGFCGDRSIYKEEELGLGYGKQETLYGAGGRLSFLDQPQFKCPSENDLYTLKDSNKGNKALTYSIGLITLDEQIYAGAQIDIENITYYLYINDWYWTMSSFDFNGTYATVGVVSSVSRLQRGYLSLTDRGVRPVINLKPDVKITSGDGTSSNPYVVKTN